MRKPDIDPRAIERLATRVLGSNQPRAIARAKRGGSTQVYRIGRGAETFYLRVAETAERGDLGPEALIHRLLRERGVRVPEVIHFDPFDDTLGRSFMVTTEIPGRPLGESQSMSDAPAILFAAGRDLAVVNSLPVTGFGWVMADPAPLRLTAEHPTHRAFILEGFESYLDRLQGGILPAVDVGAIRSISARYDAWLDVARAHLAHGDFDVTHIYHQAERYTGIIDFGEIRGADRLYDLGHYALHDGEALPTLTLPLLLAGYRQVTPLSDEDEARIQLLSLIIGIRALARVADRPAPAYQRHLTMAIRRAITALEGLH